MLDMAIDSITLFWKGRLFQNLDYVIKQALIGMVIAAVILIVAVKVGFALWLAIVIASLISGAIQPYLFKDLKYA